MKYNIELTKEEYELIMDLRYERRYYRNEYVIKEDKIEIVIRNKDFFEVCRAIIDTEDIDKVKDIRWYQGANGYIMGHTEKKKNMTLHKVITQTGSRQLIDHKNGNKLDNRKENLRECTHQQNVWNKKAKGVREMKSGRYSAYITFNKKQISLGTYDTLEEAKKARKEGEEKYFGKYAYRGV